MSKLDSEAGALSSNEGKLVLVNLALVGPSKHSIRDAHLKTEMESKEKVPRRVSKHNLKMKQQNRRDQC